MPPSRALLQYRANQISAGIFVDGAELLAKLFKAAPGELEAAFKKDLRRVVEPVERTAKALAPGSLLNVIKIRIGTRGRSISAKVGVSRAVPQGVYAPIVEFGKKARVPMHTRNGNLVKAHTRRLTPQPYLMPAIDRHKSRIQPEAQRLVDRALNRTFDGTGVTLG